MSDALAVTGRTGADEPVAFERELLATLPRLRPFAYKLAGSPDRADDLIQETAVKALSARHQFRMGTNLKAWLYLVMRNIRYSAARREGRQLDCFEDASRNLTANDRADAQLDLKELQEAMSYLPAEMREVLIAIVIDGLSYEEAAVELKAEVGTVKSRASRGRALLKAYFSDNAKGSR